jgi:hypothetical protein
MASVGIPLYIETTSDHKHQQESWDDFRGKAYAMRDDSLDSHSSSPRMLDGSSSSNLGYRGSSRRRSSTELKESALPIPSSSQRSRRRSSISSNSSVCSSSSRSSRKCSSGGAGNDKKKQKQRGSLKSLLGSTAGNRKKQKPIFPKNVPRTLSGSRMGKIDKNGRFVSGAREES